MMQPWMPEDERSDIVAAAQFDRTHPELYLEYKAMFWQNPLNWGVIVLELKPKLPQNPDIRKHVILLWEKRIARSDELPTYF